MPLRNPFDTDFGDLYAPQRRRNYFSGMPEYPVEENQKRMIQNAGSFGERPVTATAGPPEPSRNPWDSWMREMSDAFTKNGPAFDAYQAHIAKLPEYKSPSGWQKFGAVLTGAAEGLRKGGAAGWEAGQNAAMAPYRRELGEWSMKEKALAQQMDAENVQSQRRIQFMNQVRQVARDEQQARQWLDDYDFKVWAEKNNVAQDEATRANWAAQRAETNRHNIATETGAAEQRAETARSHRANEGTAVFNAQTGRINAGINQGELDLGRETENRIRNTPMLPTQSNAAYYGSLERASAERPEWKEFYDPVNNIVTRPTDLNKQQAFNDFMVRAEVLEREIRGAGNPMPAVPEPGVRIIRPPR